ncbi:hypothetical protein CUR178_02106 [Leishmania enriettii]|uniref:RanBP2-type domain-containing protein n=1 Tax=Leishmania enriettii TaxID=5663 RepID=A0A836GAY2_LEIEN|nr:hypothetical protein CUR178_02106 [Leishmania enriettii]
MLQLRGLVRVKPRLVQRCPLAVCRTDRRYAALAPGKWKCECGLHNFDFHFECYSCHMKRTDLPATKAISPLSLLSDMRMDDDDLADAPDSSAGEDNVHFVEGAWMCPACYTFNGARRVACIHCQQTRPLLRPRDAADNRLDSHEGGLEKSAMATSLASPEAQTGAAAAAAFSSRHSDESVPPQPFKKGDWYCVCGAHNFSRKTHCLKCQAPRTSSKFEAVGNGLSGNRCTDWTCPQCEMYNFSWRKVCKRCNRAQPATDGESSSAQPDSIMATGMASGWVCQACHSLNPAEGAVMCVICGSPKRA